MSICIADNGTGVPAATFDRPSDRFDRLEPDRTRKTGGAGLGLTIVKTRIEASQGRGVTRNRTLSGLQIMITPKA